MAYTFLNINIGILQRLVDQLIERADKNGRVIRDDYIGGPRRIILDFTKAILARSSQFSILLGTASWASSPFPSLPAPSAASAVRTSLPESARRLPLLRKKIIILIFIINRQKGFHINFPVHRPEKPPEGGGDII